VGGGVSGSAGEGREGAWVCLEMGRGDAWVSLGFFALLGGLVSVKGWGWGEDE